ASCDRKLLAYVLGVYFGDGYVTISKKTYIFGLNVKDKEFADEVYDVLVRLGFNPCYTFYIYWYDYDHDGKKEVSVYHSVKVFDREFVLWLSRLDVDDLRRLLRTREERLRFVRGFYDSEGCYYRGWYYDKRKKKHCFIRKIIMVNSNRRLLEFVKEILEDLGIRCSSVFLGIRKGTVIDGRAFKEDVWRLQVSRKGSVDRFLSLVGSCIPRKVGVRPPRPAPSLKAGWREVRCMGESGSGSGVDLSKYAKIFGESFIRKYMEALQRARELPDIRGKEIARDALNFMSKSNVPYYRSDRYDVILAQVPNVPQLKQTTSGNFKCGLLWPGTEEMENPGSWISAFFNTRELAEKVVNRPGDLVIVVGKIKKRTWAGMDTYSINVMAAYFVDELEELM
ncbi:MAG: LAGLIDADG family homing endonuclease, partial [Methanotrichaceae archaeon]